jgi:hypothetical protein
MSTLAVVETVLRDAAVPLSVREIVERAGDTLPTKSKTPDTVVARDLSMDIKKRGEGSLFIRTSPGRYAIRDQVPMQERTPQERTPVELGGSGHSNVVVSNVDGGNGEIRAPAVPAPAPVLGQALSSERAPTRPATKPPTPSSSEEMSA